jgi:hypothetical protein
VALYGTLVFEMSLFEIVRPGATFPSFLSSGDLPLLGKLRAVYDTKATLTRASVVSAYPSASVRPGD